MRLESRCFVVLWLISAACADAGVVEPDGSADIQPVAARAPVSFVEARVEPFASIAFAVEGPLRPGSPITVRATIIGRHTSVGTTMRLDELDIDPDSVGRLGGSRQREVGRWDGALGAGAEATAGAVVTFARPGYYRVLARAEAGTVDRPTDGTEVLRHAHQTLWLFVLPEGGRTTAGWDSTARDTAHVFAYGAYGPRVRKDLIARPRAAAPGALLTSSDVSGTIKYMDEMTGAETPVRGGVLSGLCYGRSNPESDEYDLTSPYSTAVGVTGGFTVLCPTGYEYVDGTYTMSGAVSVAKGKLGAFAGTSLFAFTGTSGVTLLVNNDVAASAFSKLEQYVPVAFSMFSTSRASMLVYASQLAIDETDNINYCRTPEFSNCPPVPEVLRMNPSRAYGEEGVFCDPPRIRAWVPLGGG